MSAGDDLRKPILPGTAASDYERYLRTDELLALQKEASELLHKDELTFQVVHQSSELLLKGAAFELERALALIADGDLLNAARLIRRANMEIDYPIQLLHILETITPYDYHLIRAGLGHGSGLDSPGFLALLHIGPRLGQAFYDQLHKAGVTVDDLYRRHQEFFALHDVAERLLDFDERVHIFRFHHLKLAQRIIGGGVVGTMGTPVEVLHQRMEHLFYKELWDVRNHITAKATESMRKSGTRTPY
ncbi:MAG TPA: tryptophan 2,3-dioxygenase family protein [Terriglobales bacterium]|nr:tryptophan 2,3-dioxygenase family protein [Terriglobales bacterium]